jgi:hypothetical protein
VSNFPTGYGAYLICQQRRDGNGLAIQSDELDFVTLAGVVDMHDCADESSRVNCNAVGFFPNEKP